MLAAPEETIRNRTTAGDIAFAANNLLKAQNKYIAAESLATTTELTSLSPTTLKLRTKLALTALRLRDYNNAIHWADRALAPFLTKHPLDVLAEVSQRYDDIVRGECKRELHLAYSRKAIAWENLGDGEKAVECAEKALEWDEGVWETRVRLVVLKGMRHDG